MKMNATKNASMLIALLMVLMAATAVVSGDGTDPLDPSDGGADWDGDGLTNAEEQAAGTDMTKADTDDDNDGIPDDIDANPEDHDNDGIDDLNDLDDDNDGIYDLIERFDGCFGTG